VCRASLWTQCALLDRAQEAPPEHLPARSPGDTRSGGDRLSPQFPVLKLCRFTSNVFPPNEHMQGGDGSEWWARGSPDRKEGLPLLRLGCRVPAQSTMRALCRARADEVKRAKSDCYRRLEDSSLLKRLCDTERALGTMRNPHLEAATEARRMHTVFARRTAGMAELADAADSKSAEGNLVGVRPPLPAPHSIYSQVAYYKELTSRVSFFRTIAFHLIRPIPGTETDPKPEISNLLPLSFPGRVIYERTPASNGRDSRGQVKRTCGFGRA
jgi:hypothetical protein